MSARTIVLLSDRLRAHQLRDRSGQAVAIARVLKGVPIEDYERAILAALKPSFVRESRLSASALVSILANPKEDLETSMVEDNPPMNVTNYGNMSIGGSGISQFIGSVSVGASDELVKALVNLGVDKQRAADEAQALDKLADEPDASKRSAVARLVESLTFHLGKVADKVLAGSLTAMYLHYLGLHP